MRTLYAIIFVFILFIQLLKAGSWEIFNKGNSELPSNKVMKITQDGNGIYWLACLSEFDSTGTLLESLGGLVRFDGIEFKMILDTSNSPISSNGVFDLSVYDYNSLIVLSKSNEFLLIENVETKLPQIRSYNSNNSPIPGNLWYVNSDSLNNIWIATEDDGLIKIPPGNREPDSWIFFNDENTIDGIHDLNYIESYSNDDIWIGTDFYGLIHYDGNNWNRVIDPYDDISQTGHYRFTTLEKTKDGTIFFTIERPQKIIAKLTLEKISGYINYNIEYFDSSDFGLSPTYLYKSAVDNEDTIWFTTSDGIIKYNNNWTLIDSTSIPLNENCFFQIFSDLYGDFFLMSCSNTGLYKFNQINSNQVPRGILPLEFSLSQNYPNPFNSSTIIEYQLYKSGDVTIELFDPIAKETSSILKKYQQKGNYKLPINLGNLSSGVYYYKLNFSNRSLVKKMILIK